MKRLLLFFALFTLLAVPALAQDAPINWHRKLCQQARDTLDMYLSIVKETKDLYAIHESADTTSEQNLGFVNKVSYMADLQRSTANFLGYVVMGFDPLRRYDDGPTTYERNLKSLNDSRTNAGKSIFDEDIRHPAVGRAYDLVILSSRLVELLWEYRLTFEYYGRDYEDIRHPSSVCSATFPIDID